jgi:gliding motility-associated-like protein
MPLFLGDLLICINITTIKVPISILLYTLDSWDNFLGLFRMKIKLKLLIVTVFIANNCFSQHNLSKVVPPSKGKPLATCNDWLGLPSQPSFVTVGDLDVPGNQITVEAEINRTTPYSGGFLYAGDIVSKHRDPININYLLRPSDAEITTEDGVYHITPPVCDIQLNKTYHVAMVYDGTTLKFYRNGFLLSQVAVSGNLFQNDFQTRIGFYEAQIYNENFIGYINEVRIWNVARTQAQLQAYMNSPLPSPATQPGLLAYFSFNDLQNKQGNTTWNGTLGGSAAINQTNPKCPFITDNDCCPPIAGTFTGNSICAGQDGLLTFHPTTIPNPPYSLSYSDAMNTYSQLNVQDNIPFPVAVNPAITTQYPLLTITDKDNCSTNITGVSATITVVPPGKFNITPDTSLCENGSAQLHVSGGTSYTWGPSEFLNDIHASNPIASPTSPTRFYVTGPDINHCTVVDSVMINILPRTIFIAPQGQSVCQGMPVLLNGNNAVKNHYAWSPATYLNDPTSPNPVSTPDQTISYQVNISDPVCAQYDSSFTVQVLVLPAPDVVAHKSNDIDCSNITSQLSASGASSYSWQPAEGLNNPNSATTVASISTTTHFIVQGTNDSGCSAQDSVTVIVTKTGQNPFSVPNAFTPNNDGINDCFGIRNWGEVTLEDFSIYNRWGQRVFETKNPGDCWDGTFHGQKQDAGNFVYLIKAKSFCGSIQKKGNLLLIR